MSTPDNPDLYMLGTFARRVTIYSQQVRAINLVDAINFYRRPLQGLEIAIVGGGAAGITAAARAIEHGAKVTLFEQNDGVLSIQQGCGHRWLHPAIYDWPFVEIGGKQHDDDARLAVMDWSATWADQFALSLSEKWKVLIEQKPEQIRRPKIATTVKYVSPTEQGYQIGYEVASEADPRHETFPLVILAVGFGLEPKGTGRNSYWEHDPLHQISRSAGQTVLIAGYGDGALTDLMRVCLRNFDHEQVLANVVSRVSAEQREAIKKIEQDKQSGNATFLTGKYKEIQIPEVQTFLRSLLVQARKVFLTGRGQDLFDHRASALNRLVVSQLLHIGAFTFVPMEEADNLDLVERYDESIATLQRKIGVEFSDIVLRFGPDSAIAKISSRPDGAKPMLDELSGVAQLQNRWKSLQSVDDPTLLRLWDDFSPISSDLENSCVILLAPDTPDDDAMLDIASDAIEIVNQSRSLNVVPVTASVTDCTRNQRALVHTVRALCRAPIVIFDIGKEMGQKNPAGMMLLGIRSVVRRGLTVVIHQGDVVDWNKLPFNLKELHVLPVEANPESAGKLASFIVDGMSALDTSVTGYRDLPVFEIVRRPRRRTPLLEQGKTEAFVLCSFSEKYTKEVWGRLGLLLRKVKVPSGTIEPRRVVDYASPLLVGERLYELTRFAGLCIVDWTEWRANVFFELGVRLAVNPIPPICVLNKPKDDKPDREEHKLMRCLNVLRYSIGKHRKDQQFETRFADEMRRNLENFGSANPIYLAAQRNIFLAQEYHDLDLLKHVDEVLGSDVSRSGRLPLLYDGNIKLSRQAWSGSVEALKAAQLLVRWKIKQPGADKALSDRLSADLREVNSRLAEILDINLDAKVREYYDEGIDDE